MYFKAVVALIQGFRLCFFDRRIRTLCLRPWLIGGIVYLLSVGAAIMLHGHLVQLFVGGSFQGWGVLYYYFVWIVAALGSISVAVLISLVFVMALTSMFQTAIAAQVLDLYDVSVESIGNSGQTGIFRGIIGSLAIEFKKLAILGPIGVVVIVLGVFPLFTPLSIIISAWLIGINFIDLTLDLLGYSGVRRFRVFWDRVVPLTILGAELLFFWSIPLAGLFLPPVASAAAAWLYVNGRWGDDWN